MKKLLVGLLALGSISAFANTVCVDYSEAKNMNSICAEVNDNGSTVLITNPKLADGNIQWSIGKGLNPKSRAQRICESLGVDTQLVLSYKIEHLGQEQANVNMSGSTLTSRFDAITQINCLKE